MPHCPTALYNWRAAAVQLWLDRSCCITYNKPMEPNERLDAWREAASITKAELARRINCDKGNFHNLLSGYWKPTIDTAVEIERETSGVIPVSAWVGFSPKQRPQRAA